MVEMNEAEIRRLAHATNAHRPDWPIASLTTFIRNKLGYRGYRDAAVAMAWVATDAKVDGSPASEKPSRVLEAGPWWQSAVVGEGQGRPTPRPPKSHEQCAKHVGQWSTNCGGCRSDQLAFDEPEDQPVEIPAGLTGVAAVRAVLATVVPPGQANA